MSKSHAAKKHLKETKANEDKIRWKIRQKPNEREKREINERNIVKTSWKLFYNVLLLIAVVYIIHYNEKLNLKFKKKTNLWTKFKINDKE